jgi:hypothetical protein
VVVTWLTYTARGGEVVVREGSGSGGSPWTGIDVRGEVVVKEGSGSGGSPWTGIDVRGGTDVVRL